jgi:hypothetical protein
MKLVRTLKKTKKNNEATPLAVGEKPLITAQTPPRVARMSPVAPDIKAISPQPAPVAPQAKLNLPEARSVAPAPSALPTVTIEALVDVGFGNQLFLRGQGAGLSWDRGTPLACVDGQTWRWSAPTTDKLTFKLLLNDKVWAQGEDIIATPGKCIGVVPRF